MIIDAKTVLLTIIIVAVAFYYGLKLIRRFALSIAQENHDANAALDAAEERQRRKRERDADAAAASAFAKVEPLLPNVKTPPPPPAGTSGAGSSSGTTAAAVAPAPSSSSTAPVLAVPKSAKTGKLSEEGSGTASSAPQPKEVDIV